MLSKVEHLTICGFTTIPTNTGDLLPENKTKTEVVKCKKLVINYQVQSSFGEKQKKKRYFWFGKSRYFLFAIFLNTPSLNSPANIVSALTDPKSFNKVAINPVQPV